MEEGSQFEIQVKLWCRSAATVQRRLKWTTTS